MELVGAAAKFSVVELLSELQACHKEIPAIVVGDRIRHREIRTGVIRRHAPRVRVDRNAAGFERRGRDVGDCEGARLGVDGASGRELTGVLQRRNWYRSAVGVLGDGGRRDVHDPNVARGVDALALRVGEAAQRSHGFAARVRKDDDAVRPSIGNIQQSAGARGAFGLHDRGRQCGGLRSRSTCGERCRHR